MLVTLKELASFLDAIGVRAGQSVVVLGAGAVAMAAAFFATLRGAHPVVVIGRRPEVEERVRRVGADAFIDITAPEAERRLMAATGGQGADRIIDAAGDPALFSRAIGFLADGGVIAPYAVSEMLERTVSLSGGPRTWSLVRAKPDEPAAHQHLLDLVGLGIVPFSAFYSHRMPLAQIAGAFELLWQKKAFKVVIEMEGT